MIDVQIANEQSAACVDSDRLRRAVEMILADAGIAQAEISLAVVDDATIHELNRRWLDHDYPTDVLSFALARSADQLDGEVIVSAETAARTCGQYGWTADDELLLYVIHGALHLVGFDDRNPADEGEMRRRERHYLQQFGLVPHDLPADSEPPSQAS